MVSSKPSKDKLHRKSGILAAAAADIDDEMVLAMSNTDKIVNLKAQSYMKKGFDWDVQLTNEDVNIAQESWNQIISGAVKKYQKKCETSGKATSCFVKK